MINHNFRLKDQQKVLELHMQIHEAIGMVEQTISEGRFETAGAYITFIQKYVSELDKLKNAKVHEDQMKRMVERLSEVGINIEVFYKQEK